MKDKNFIVPDTFTVTEKDTEKFPLKKKTAIVAAIIVSILFVAAIVVKLVFNDPFF